MTNRRPVVDIALWNIRLHTTEKILEGQKVKNQRHNYAQYIPVTDDSINLNFGDTFCVQNVKFTTEIDMLHTSSPNLLCVTTKVDFLSYCICVIAVPYRKTDHVVLHSTTSVTLKANSTCRSEIHIYIRQQSVSM